MLLLNYLLLRIFVLLPMQLLPHPVILVAESKDVCKVSIILALCLLVW